MPLDGVRAEGSKTRAKKGGGGRGELAGKLGGGGVGMDPTTGPGLGTTDPVRNLIESRHHHNF